MDNQINNPFSSICLDRVFDIGANIGSYTYAMLELGAKEVIALEPGEVASKALKAAFGNEPRVKIIEKAVSFEACEIPFFEAECSTISTASVSWISDSRFSETHKWCQPRKVPAVTIDQLVAEFGSPNHIKIDVEGYEYHVIMGMSKLVPALLSFEWAEESRDNLAKSLYYLHELGYKQFASTFSTDDLLEAPQTFSSFAEFTTPFLKSLDPARKQQWGMVYVKP